MPRETVRSADYNFVPLKEGADGSNPWDPMTRLGCVEVGWSKKPTGHVELATCDDSILHNLFEQVATAVEDKTDVEVVVREFFHGGGIWISLDREGSNELIRKVRKARDDAFGRDE